MWKYVLTSLTWPCPIHINVKLRFRAIPFVRAWHPFDRDPECSNHSVPINHFTRKIMSVARKYGFQDGKLQNLDKFQISAQNFGNFKDAAW